MTRVGLIFGGRSVEHEISVTTAAKVLEAFASLSHMHELVPIYITRGGAWVTGPGVLKLLALDSEIRRQPAEAKAARLVLRDRFRDQLGHLARGPVAADAEQLFIAPDASVRVLSANPEWQAWFRRRTVPRMDVAFPLIHGTYGEDGTLQGLFELADIPYIGPGVSASAVGMDKIQAKLVFRGAALPTLDYVSVTRREFLEDEARVMGVVEASVGYPLVVKPATTGSSVGISKVGSREDLRGALERAIRFSQRVLVERAVEDRIEVQCAVLGNHELTVSACEELLQSAGIVGFEQKYLKKHSNKEMRTEDTHQAPTQSPESLEQYLQEMSKEARRAIGPRGICRPDFLRKYLRRGEGTEDADLAASRIPAQIQESLAEDLHQLSTATFRAIGARGICRVDFLIDAHTMRPYVNEVNTIPGSLCLRLWEASGVKPPDLVDRLIALALETHREKTATRFESEEGEMLVDQKHLMIPGK